MPNPEDSEPFLPEGAGPPAADYFESRLAAGGRPVLGPKVSDHYHWIRHRDEQATDLVALLALADMPPPAVMPLFDGLIRISSVTWMINFTSTTLATRERWWLVQSSAENLADGYSSQQMGIWNFDRTLVATMRQNVAIFE